MPRKLVEISDPVRTPPASDNPANRHRARPRQAAAALRISGISVRAAWCRIGVPAAGGPIIGRGRPVRQRDRRETKAVGPLDRHLETGARNSFIIGAEGVAVDCPDPILVAMILVVI